MGTRGPRPQPTKLKLLRGNPGKRRLNRQEPQPKGKLPDCPEYLSPQAAETWRRFADTLSECGIATSADAVALELLCSSYALYVDALDNVQKLGTIWLEPAKGKIPKFVYSPYWAVMNREFKNVKQMLDEFGMTPSSRSSVTKAPDTSPNNPFAAFMKKA